LEKLPQKAHTLLNHKLSHFRERAVGVPVVGLLSPILGNSAEEPAGKPLKKEGENAEEMLKKTTC
jgi:hypothetical protein